MTLQSQQNTAELQNELQKTVKELLESNKVAVVIGYGQLGRTDNIGGANDDGKNDDGDVGPVFITQADQTGQIVWNDQCLANLTVYLTRKEIKKLGKSCIIVKGCDAKTLAILETENQIDRDEIVVVGVVCSRMQEHGIVQPKCLSCDVQQPRHCDIVIGDAVTDLPDAGEDRYAKLGQLKAMTESQRFEYWKKELARCIKCYACRQNCPLCYCEVCVADKNQPTRIDTSATLKGNFAWNILRAFHLAGRCIGCSACTNACPAGIDLDLLNLSLAKVAEEQFQYRAGMERGVEPLIGTFSPDDQESFIR